MTKEVFKELMNFLDGAYPKQHLFEKENTGKTWWECLKDLNNARAMEAVKEVSQTEEFPTIAKIRNAATYFKPPRTNDPGYARGIDPQPKKNTGLTDEEFQKMQDEWQKELEEMRNAKARTV